MSNGNSDAVFKVLDFAGGTVVHINAGVAGLMCAICLGKRKDMGPPHNMVLTFIGASMLWVGWFGFNAGSAVTAGMQAGMAMTVTQIATAVAGFTWMLVEWICRGKPTVIGICSGAVAGLVAITPASGFVGPAGSMAIGVAAGVLCYWGVTGLKRILGADDALDCFGVHGVGGIVGALLTGVFAISEYGGTAGLIEGNAAQMINQIQDDTGADISIEDDGTVYIGAVDGPSAEAARAAVNAIANPTMPEVGERYLGTVVKTTNFGAFVSLLPGKDGLLHISQIAHERVNAVSDYLKEGQVVKVKVLEADDKGRVRLSRKALLDPPPKREESPPPAPAESASQ